MLDGALKGDMAEQDNGIAGTIGQTVVGLIPLVGMAADIRGTSAAVSKWWKTGEGFGDVLLAGVGWLPGGDIFKGVGKVGSKVGQATNAGLGRAVGGFRSPASNILSRKDITRLKKEFKQIGGDPSMLRFNQGTRTSFLNEDNIINVRGDVMPASWGSSPRSTMSSRATLAHEFHGHAAMRGTPLKPTRGMTNLGPATGRRAILQDYQQRKDRI